MKTLLLLLLLGIVTGCRSREPEPLLIGSWAWEKSVGGFSGNDVIRHTDRRVDTFTNSGKYESKSGGVLRMTADYTLKPSGLSGPGASLYNLSLTNVSLYRLGQSVVRLDAVNYSILTLDRQKLVYLDADWSEGYAHHFQRK